MGYGIVRCPNCTMMYKALKELHELKISDDPHTNILQKALDYTLAVKDISGAVLAAIDGDKD